MEYKLVKKFDGEWGYSNRKWFFRKPDDLIIDNWIYYLKKDKYEAIVKVNKVSWGYIDCSIIYETEETTKFKNYFSLNKHNVYKTNREPKNKYAFYSMKKEDAPEFFL